MKRYHFDVPVGTEGHGADRRRGERDDFYTVVIRRAGQSGWVFRFESYGDFAEETLQALNARTVGISA